jgi:hypothetical protein
MSHRVAIYHAMRRSLGRKNYEFDLAALGQHAIKLKLSLRTRFQTNFGRVPSRFGR